MKINWWGAPSKTEYGFGMMTADIALDKDSCVTLACHKDDIEKVNQLLKDVEEYKYKGKDGRTKRSIVAQSINHSENLQQAVGRNGCII